MVQSIDVRFFSLLDDAQEEASFVLTLPLGLCPLDWRVQSVEVVEVVQQLCCFCLGHFHVQLVFWRKKKKLQPPNEAPLSATRPSHGGELDRNHPQLAFIFNIHSVSNMHSEIMILITLHQVGRNYTHDGFHHQLIILVPLEKALLAVASVTAIAR